MGVATHQPWSKIPAAFCMCNSSASGVYTQLLTLAIGRPTYSRHTCSSCRWITKVTANTTAILCTVDTHALALLPAWLLPGGSWLLNCMKILLTVHKQLTDITLNYSIKNIQNNVRHMYDIYIRENPPFNSLVWGSLMLAPITLFTSTL